MVSFMARFLVFTLLAAGAADARLAAMAAGTAVTATGANAPDHGAAGAAAHEPVQPQAQPQVQAQAQAQAQAQTQAQIQAQAHALAKLPAALPPHGHRLAVDRSGRKQAGKASVYAGHFQGRRMADGGRFRHQGSAAASKTLPIGTVAKVTNLSTGRTAVVTVHDHGPFVDGRTLDVSRATARQLGISRKDGVAQVVVAPVAVPQENGTMKAGAGILPGPATAQ